MNVRSKNCPRKRIAHVCSQTKLPRVLLGMVILLGLPLAQVPTLQASGINRWMTPASPGSGDWTDSTHWSEGAVPGTAGHTDDDIQFIANQRGHISLTQAMFPTATGMTADTFSAPLSNSGSSGIYLDASGSSGNPLVMNFGDAATPPNRVVSIGNYTKWNLTWVDLNIDGTTATASTKNNGIALMLDGNDKVKTQANLVAVDTKITIDNLPTPNIVTAYNLGLLIQGENRDGAQMRMTRGELTISNDTSQSNSLNNAGIAIGAQGSGELSSKGNPLLSLKDTVLTAGQMNLFSSGTFQFDGAGAVAPSDISGVVRITSNGLVDLISGEISIGSLDWAGGSGNNRVLIHGADVTVGSTTLDRANSILDVSDGSLTIDSLTVYSGQSHGLQLSGTGTLDVTNSLTLGRLPNSASLDGLLNMTGGTLTAAEVQVGNQNGDGYWRQTGGTATVNGDFLLSLKGPDSHSQGAREVTVGKDATLILTGDGFKFKTWTGGNANTLLLDNWNTPGTLKFDPSSSLNPQTLYAFGEDESVLPVFTDKADIPTLMLAHDGIGTLDLTALNGGEKLLVLPSGNFTNNALYINELLGMTSGTVTNHLDSSLNIYYNAYASPGLNGLTYELNSGGFLIGVIAVPEPSSLLLLGLGSVCLLRRRKRAKAYSHPSKES